MRGEELSYGFHGGNGNGIEVRRGKQSIFDTLLFF